MHDADNKTNWDGGSDVALEAGVEKNVEFDVNVSKNVDNAYLQVSMGQIYKETESGREKIDTPVSDITLSDFSMIDKNEAAILFFGEQN